MASLSHTVIFHGAPSDLSLLDSDGKPKWFSVEGIYDHISHGRATMVPKLWDVSTGRPIATGFQDGMVRFKEGVKQLGGGKDSLFGKFPGGTKSEKL
jgi:acyl-CoA thioesterase